MATYKLIQDIEAEDHILGPLSLRQFIFALIAVFCFYICFIAITKHLTVLLVPFLPPGLFFAFFAFPFGRDQPTEVWALAKLRFLFKPRRRIWDQSGIKELVTITAPKKIERVLTNGLSANEVDSRLKALANTIDSRGWAVKNVNINSYSQPNPLATIDSDRLIDINNLPQQVPSYDVQPSDDILDEVSNPIAQQFDHMISESTQAHRQQLLAGLNEARASQPAVPAPNSKAPADYWFMRQSVAPAKLAPDQAMFPAAQLVPPGGNAITDGTTPPPAPPPADETALAAQLKANSSKPASYGHLRTLKTLDDQLADQAQATADSQALAANTSGMVSGVPPSDPAILSLAENNDLNVATLAREAHKVKGGDEPPQDEVVISLH